MSAPLSAQELIQALTAKVGALKQLLLDEQKTVAQRTDSNLQPLLATKANLLQDIETLEHQRRQALADAGLEDGKAGMQAWLEMQTDAEQLAVDWAALLGQLRECQMINEANGNVIRQSLEHNEQLLHILRGTNADDDPAYGPQGQRPPGATGRDLGKA
ncbi:MAG: flagellar protein FlgN [Ectothiorhodospiraceae bacterium]|nr:flagellar protein FlgN [Ectothiorhodospiraceae bacterium]MCH8506444.1 flagellar protein FlgN [Ectothiorhodospiraceae bacterium]